MVKRIVWTETAKKARREILEYWIKHNGSKTYWDNRRNPDDLHKNIEA